LGSASSWKGDLQNKAMGQSSSEEQFALPTQQVVSISGGDGASTSLPAAVQAQARVATATAQRVGATEVKMPMVWDKSSFRLERQGSSNHIWELSGDFTAEVPCELRADFHCNEVRDGPNLYYAPVEQGGPGSFRMQFPKGRNTMRLAGAQAIDMKRWPLEVFWRYKQRAKDIIPIVFSLTAKDTALITHLSLEVEKVAAPREAQSSLFSRGASSRFGMTVKFDPVIVRQKVVMGGKEYPIEEVYGLAEMGKEGAHDESAKGEPCVICLCEPRTTAVEPCNHLCVCEECGGALSAGATIRGDRCPICRGDIKGIKVFAVNG